MRLARWLALALLSLSLHAQKFYTYVGPIESKSVLIAWGTVEGAGNTIGLTSVSFGRATVKIGETSAQTQQNWIIVKDLRPDTEYPYEVTINNRKIGQGTVRTYPERSNKLAFFVIGDYGIGNRRQYSVADAMAQEYERRRASDNPVRFVLTVGDNIYADPSFGLANPHSGDQDRDWESKFFRPYERLIQHIPFYPTLGNHDGNASENRGDLAVYLDNFFFPEARPARWYRFSFGELAEFFALDSSENTEEGRPSPAYAPGGEQFRWLKQTLPQSRLPWKIPYFHHPPYNAGPRHGSSYDDLRHFVDLFQQTGVKVVFTGHEHNFQFTDRTQTGGVLYVISGAGGELRSGNVTRKMERAKIAGWSAQNHFLVVEILDRTMKITPVSYETMTVKDKNGKRIEMPLTVNLP